VVVIYKELLPFLSRIATMNQQKYEPTRMLLAACAGMFAALVSICVNYYPAWLRAPSRVAFFLPEARRSVSSV
jgi:hypothetical protein